MRSNVTFRKCFLKLKRQLIKVYHIKVVCTIQGSDRCLELIKRERTDDYAARPRHKNRGAVKPLRIQLDCQRKDAPEETYKKAV